MPQKITAIQNQISSLLADEKTLAEAYRILWQPNLFTRCSQPFTLEDVRRSQLAAETARQEKEKELKQLQDMAQFIREVTQEAADARS
ncbi:MAG: hypothetical protein U1D67_03515 [Dehalococcoidia bacterium]|nr:hypothetical protein [Dehalococcoidia bacterium]